MGKGAGVTDAVAESVTAVEWTALLRQISARPAAHESGTRRTWPSVRCGVCLTLSIPYEPGRVGSALTIHYRLVHADLLERARYICHRSGRRSGEFNVVQALDPLSPMTCGAGELPNRREGDQSRELVRFGIDGASFEIDLQAPEAHALRVAVSRYTRCARRIS
jgi:Lsr2